jgi:putative membrane protein
VSTTIANPDNTELAIERTWLAHERTLMAWVRTATSMISFGFSIYKFFEFEESKGVRRSGLLTPRDFAIALVSIALISLFVATINNRMQVKQLKPYLAPSFRSQAQAVAMLISVFGLAVLVITILHG